MASERKCCVPQCNVTRDDKVTMHCFPNPDVELERFRTWLYKIGGDTLGLENHYIYKRRRVCHNHFEPKYRTWTKTLTCNAIPTLQLPNGQPRKKQNVIETDSDSEPSPLKRRRSDSEAEEKENEDIENLLSLVGEKSKYESTLEINSNMADIWKNILKKGLSKENKEDLTKKIPLLKNCKVSAPVLNAEIMTSLSSAAKARDQRLMEKQNQIGIIISSLNEVLKSLITHKDEDNIEKILNCICLLCDLQYMESQIVEDPN